MRKLLLLLLLVLSTLQLRSENVFNAAYFQRLDKTHDIETLPKWGPYSKKYAGISHIPDLKQGLRFDLTAMPGIYRNQVMVPNVLFPSGYYPWNIAPDFSTITYRYEIEWKDKVYTDISYLPIDSANILVQMVCVNNTSLPQALQLNLAGFLTYPDNYPDTKSVYSDQVRFFPAMPYKNLSFSKPRPSDGLVYDGWFRSEERHSGYLTGNGIGKGFGRDEGDRVEYQIEAGNLPDAGTLTLRYRLNSGNVIRMTVEGVAKGDLTLKGSGRFETTILPYASLRKNPTLRFISHGGDPIELDGFFLGPENESASIEFRPNTKNLVPDFEKDIEHRQLFFHYPDLNLHYGIAWDFPGLTTVREVLDEELDVVFKKYVHEHNYLVLPGDGKGHFLNVFMRPVELEPMGRDTFFALVSCGSKQEVHAALGRFTETKPAKDVAIRTNPDCFNNDLPAGKTYQFSQKMLRTALLSNIVYPIYTQGQLIRHFTPGKWWNSLYTWDAGFIALGLAEIDPSLSIQCLNAYTTPGGSQSAFIHHGSPVPVQMYAFLELWNKTQSNELLDYFYPRLKRYYEYMTGKTPGSVINPLQSGLLKTWDYFYSSGGWDDYPPQKAVRDQHLEKTTAPVITSSHMIRVARILRMVAVRTGHSNDVKTYDQDIKRLKDALQRYSWDAQSGYFSYVVHDSTGKPTGYLRHEPSGTNFNMGLDGAYPLFAGICTPEQEKILLDKIFSDEHMWSKAGICVVDKQAPYYRIDGYWNGAVWMPHQWFIWKTMLDLGKTDLAWKIADKALAQWKIETDETYFTFEHWLAKTGRGAGWHQFGALSSPVLTWYSAYYKPGTVSVGLESWIEQQHFDVQHASYNATIAFDQSVDPHQRCILVVMNPNFQYQASIDGRLATTHLRHPGMLEIMLPASNKTCHLLVKNVQPSNVYDITSSGAIGDGRFDNAKILQTTIDRCSANGGGVVLVPEGTFLTGPFQLKSNVELHVTSMGRILANPDESVYVESAFRQNQGEGSIWIGGKDADNVTISGSGTIDGNGVAFMGPEEEAAFVLKPFDRIDRRPHLFTPIHFSRLRIRDVTLKNSAYWCLHLVGCNDVIIENVTILNHRKIRNSDGIDPDHCKNVTIRNCYIESGDDCICPKTRREYLEYGPTENITVSQCILKSSSCSVKLGSENMDAIRNVRFSDCRILDSNRGIGIQHRDEGIVENVVFENMYIQGRLFDEVWWGKAEPIYVTAYKRQPGNAKDANWRFAPGQTVGKVGSIRNILFRNIVAESENGIFVGGEPDKISGLQFENVRVKIVQTSSKQGGVYDLRPSDTVGMLKTETAGFYLDDASNVSLKNCTVEWGTIAPWFGPAVKARNVDGITIGHLIGTSAFPEKFQKIVLESCSGSKID
jgi:polygalacturonase